MAFTRLEPTGVNTSGSFTFANVNVSHSIRAESFLYANGTPIASGGGGGVAVTVSANAQPNITSVGTLDSLNVTGPIDLGSVGNISIAGGDTDYVLSTDGHGHLNWVQAAAGNPVGQNTAVQFNDNGSFGSDPKFTYDKTNDTLYVGNITTENTINAASVYVTSLSSQQIAIAYTGGQLVGGPDLIWEFNNAALFTTGLKSNGAINTTGNVTGAYIFGSGNNLSNIQGTNVSGAVSYATTANSIAGANVSGYVANATHSNIADVANSVAGANVSGAVSYATTANSIAVANVSGIGNIATINKDGNASNILYGNGVFAGAPVTYGNANVATFLASFGSNTISTTGNITVGSVLGNSYNNPNFVTPMSSDPAWAFGTFANASDVWLQAKMYGSGDSHHGFRVLDTTGSGNVLFSVDGTGNTNLKNISASGNVTASYFIGNGQSLTSLAGANVTGYVANATHSNVADAANSVAGANVTGTVASATTAGTVTTAAQPNITSVGTLTGLTSSGTVNVTAASNVSLGPVANVHITGGSAGYVLSTDGSGTLQWVAQSSGGSNASVVASQYIAKYNLSSNQVLTNSTDNLIAFNNVVYDPQSWFNTGTSEFKPTIAGYYKITCTVWFNTGTSGSGNQYNLQIRKNGSSVSITQNPEIGNTGQTLITSESVYLNGTTDKITFTVYSTAGSITLLSGYGSNFEAFLVGSASATSNIGNANSNVNVASANANVTISVNGTANVAVFANTGVTVNGNITTSANSNINVGGELVVNNYNQHGGAGYAGMITMTNSGGGTNPNKFVRINSTGGLEIINSGYTTTIFALNDAGNLTVPGNISGSYIIGNGSALSSITGANVTGAVNYATTANSVAGANVTGAVSYATTANSVAVANVSGIGNIATVNKDGNASNILYGNGSFAAAPVTYGNSNVSTFLASFGSNSITTTGNVSVGNIIGNGQALTGLAGANVTGYVANATHSNVADAANSVAGANVTGTVSSATTATTAGTVTTAAQPNITSVGTLSSLSITGGLTVGGNLTVNGTLTSINSTILEIDDLAITLANDASTSTQANGAGIIINGASANMLYISTSNAFVFSHKISADGSLLSNVTGGNVTGYVANATHSNVADVANSVAGANVTGAVSYATTANAVAGANVSGAVSYATTANSVAVANVSGIGNIATINKDGNASNILYGNGVFAGAPVTYGNSNVVTLLASFGSNTISTTGNVTAGNLSTGGSGGNISGANNITANFFVGNGASLSAIAGANVTGAVSYATTANSVAVANVSGIGNIATINKDGNASNILYGNGSFAALPTSTYGNSNVATFLASFGSNTISTTGNITAGNANLGNLATANFFSGSGNNLSNIQAANISGQVANANATNYLMAGSALNGNYYIGLHSALTGFIQGLGNTALVANATTGALYATSFNGNVVATTVGGTLTTAAQPNITSVGTLTSLAVTGNITSGNANLGNLATANFFSGSGNNLSNIQAGNITGQVGNALIAGTVYTAAQPNITSVGTLTSLSVTGNTTSGNLIGVHANGNSNVNIPSANGNVTISAVGNANIVVVTGTGANITGTLNTSGNVIAQTKLLVGTSSTTLTNPVAVFSGSGATYSQLSMQNPTGTGSADITVYGNNGDDTQSWTDIGFTGNGFNDANYTVTAAGDGYLFVQGNTSFGGNLVLATGATGTTKDIVFATGGFLAGNVKGRLYNANGILSITGGFATTGNITANNITATNISYTGSMSMGSGSGGTLSGANLISANYFTGTLTSTSSSQPNVTSVGSLVGLTVSNATGVVNFTTTANVTLGAVANLHISGGTSGQYLQTNGSGTLTWATVSLTPAGSNTQIQFNDAGAANASAGLTFDKTTSTLSANVVALKKFNETVLASANTSATISPDLSTGTVFRYTANASFTFNGFTNAVSGSSATVVITQDATGGRLLTSTMKFAGGAKTLSTAANAIDVISVFYDGTTYYASLAKGFA